MGDVWQPATAGKVQLILMSIREIRPEPIIQVASMVGTEQWFDALEQRAVVTESMGMPERAVEWRNLAETCKGLDEPRRLCRSLAIQMIAEAQAAVAGKFIAVTQVEGEDGSS